MNWRVGVLPLLAAGLFSAELPDFYKKVDRVTWIVPDLDQTLAGWRAAGVADVIFRDEVSLAVTTRGVPVNVRWKAANLRLGELSWDFVQPLEGDDGFAEFLRETGGGVLSLMHRAPSLEAYNAEIVRLAGLGVGILLRGDRGPSHFVYFDTRAQGKYSLGLCYLERDSGGDPAPPPFRITQFAFVANSAEPAASYWEKLGFPKMSVNRSVSTNRRYRGKPGEFEMDLGWQRHGKIVYEWILPLKGPSAYHEHLKAHGEGFQHFGVGVDDIDAAVARWEALGYKVVQSGGWGEAGKPGSGRFAYIDTSAIGGVMIELLWNHRTPAGDK